MKTKTWILSMSILATLFSCGELFDFEEPATVDTATMTLNQHELMLMMGSTYMLKPIFTPDSVSNEEIYWESGNEQIVRMRNDTIVALMPGRCIVTAISVQRRLTDSCMVNVQHPWTVNPVGYRYDMVIYARITINGNTDHGMMVAAFCGEELRGVAVHHRDHGIDYDVLRIYSNQPQGEKITFKCYDPSTGLVKPLSTVINFDGEAHGSLQQLFPLQ